MPLSYLLKKVFILSCYSINIPANSILLLKTSFVFEFCFSFFASE